MSGVPPTLPPGYRIEPVVEGGPPYADQVLDLWAREGISLRGREGRRVHEVLFVGLHDSDGVVGEASVYLQRHPAMGIDLWYLRTFTAREHRMKQLARALAFRARDHLTQQFVDGTDTRGAGFCVEVENPGLRTFDMAVWQILGMPFVGENDRGHHVRVRFFPGAQAPLPA